MASSKSLWVVSAVVLPGLLVAACVSNPASDDTTTTDGGGNDVTTSDGSEGDSSSTDGSSSDTGTDAARPVPPHVGTFGWKSVLPAQNVSTQIAYDNAGNMYAAVNYTASYNADATHSFTYEGSFDDIGVIAFNPAGKILWTTSYATASDEEALDIVSDGTDIYLAGYFSSASLDFGNGNVVSRVGSASEFEPFVVKLRGSDGQAQWVQNFATPSATASYTGCDHLAFGGGHLGVACVSDRSIAFPLTTGATQTIAPQNTTGPGSIHMNNFALASLDPSTGKAAWALVAGSDYQTTADAIAMSNDGSMAVSAFTFGSAMLDSTGTLAFTNPRGDDHPAMFVFKLGAADGHTAWTAKFTDSAQNSNSETSDSPHCVAFDSKGDLVVSGQVYGTVPIAGKNVTAHDTGYGDAFVAHLDGSNGSAQWVLPYGGTNVENPAAIAVDAWDEIFVAGEYRSTDFAVGTQTLPPPGANGTYALKLDSGGNVYWGYGTVEEPDASADPLYVAGQTRVMADPNTGGVTVVTAANGAGSVDLGDGQPVVTSVTTVLLVHRAP